MRIVLQTVYEKVDQEFLTWYTEQLRKAPGLNGVADDLEKKHYAAYQSKDPTSEVIATTTYRVEK